MEKDKATREEYGCFVGEILSLQELISSECLSATNRPGGQSILTIEGKERLVMTAKLDWGTRHMPLAEIQCEAELGHASKTTVS